MLYEFDISKEDLLERYANSEQKEMIILNGFNVAEGGDKRISARDEVDADDHCVDIGTTDELIRDCPEVRVLIKPGSDIKTILTLLSKIAAVAKEGVEPLQNTIPSNCFPKETEDAKEIRIAKFLFRNNISCKDVEWYSSKQKKCL